ncbi:hypothetical protein SARC_03395 [Sphaeroforma arctica JP610]|uniref:Mitochondrial import inner membrane translocase subunit TIM23 n=1 Tax=Sphaeroforma arctica JP610 TaxID=667725 RepID=A0A0L0G807_9EUKA|nr:hypothetical protein SARC_03395 [Sphaeroforma arctica JP610]KNC84378.1 hypothetical protein SARC_03395 [Sphaeroforma arctica JP610]|eukprot:XP_014158280.1 hypothetical protein SARC_03395 [Sphaeroforma arctica JP610]
MCKGGLNSGSGLSPYSQQFAGLDFSINETDSGTDFLFEEDAQKKKRSWGETIFYATGTSYLSGQVIGSAWGVMEGLRNPDAVTQRLKINSVLNSVTRRGPFMGNFAAVLALMYTIIDGSVIKVRGGTDDVINTVGSGAAAGALFRATAGGRAIGLGALVGAGVAGAAVALRQVLTERRNI